MRVGIDARLLLMPLRGMGVNLNRVLNEILAVDSVDEFFLYVDTTYEHNAPASQYQPRLEALAAFPNVRVIDTHAPNEFLWEQLYLPLKARKHDLDVLHMPGNRAPFWRPARRVIATIHDVIEILPPTTIPVSEDPAQSRRQRFYVWRVKRYLSFLYRFVFRRLDLVITDSESSRRDLQRFCGVSSSKTRVVYLAPNETFRRLDIRKQDYLLAFGSEAPHKNCDRILQAYAGLPAEVKRQYALRLVGRTRALETLAGELGEPNIIFQDSDFGQDFTAKLVELLNGATAFVFVSLYEGFGIPPLEAMACGTAVIASNVSSIPEVVADAALLVDPRNVDQIRDAMMCVLTDSAVRTKLEVAGERRVRDFSWKASAAKHLEIYRSLATAGSR